jgi:hypothetical protein
MREGGFTQRNKDLYLDREDYSCCVIRHIVSQVFQSASGIF